MKTGHLLRLAVLSYGMILLVGFIASSCFIEPSYPNSPKITFKGFSRYGLEAGSSVGQPKRDSLVITIGFEDGDGDLGYNLPIDSSASARYKQAGGWGNYKIRIFRFENNKFTELSPGENGFLIFPPLSREGKKGPIEGNLELRQIYPYSTKYKNDPVKFRIQIRDRALNLSNEIETDTLIVPFPEH